MADTKHKLKKYKQYLESNPDGDKVLSVLHKLDALPVSIALLQDTGIGKLINSFRKKPDGIGVLAKSIVLKWKNLVAEEAKKSTKLDSEDEQEYVPEQPTKSKYEPSYNPTPKSQSDEEYSPQPVVEEYSPEEVKYKPSHRSVNKYAKYSNEKYSPQHTGSSRSLSKSKEKYIPTKIPSPENSDETYSPSRINDSPSPYSPQKLNSESEEEEAYDQATPDSQSDEYDPTNNDTNPSSASYTPTPISEQDQKHKSKSSRSDRSISKSANSSSHSDKHKNGSSSSKSSNKGEKHISNSHSDKHSSKHSDRHKKSENRSHDSKSKELLNGAHSSASVSHSHKDKKSSSHSKSSDKHSGNSDNKKTNSGNSDSKSSDKHSSKSDHKNSHSSNRDSKTNLDKNRNEKRKKVHHVDDSFDLFSPDDSAVVKRVKVIQKPKPETVKTQESSSERKEKHSKHQSSSSSTSKSKERLDKKDTSSKVSKHKEERTEKHESQSKSKTSSSSKGEKRKAKVEESSQDATEGFSFDDFLNCDVNLPKKKMKKESGAGDTTSKSKWSSSLSVSKPSASKMATRVTDDSGFSVPKPTSQKIDIQESDILSLLPETSATYRPLRVKDTDNDRKLNLATFDPMVIGTKQGKRTQVYSGRKHGLTEMKSLFNLCIQVLMDNIDALDYVGGVPYDIMKPVLERCTVQQLFRLEDLNPHFVGDTEELWAIHCEKDFKNAQPDEMESWRELYLRSLEEREARLEKLRYTMNKQQAAKPKSRQVQLAYVDNYVKPPREVLRKQQRYGTGKVVSASNSIQSTSKGARANFSHHVAIPQPKAVKQVSPMMQKIKKMLGRQRR